MCFVKLGYYERSQDVEDLMTPLVRLLDGENDRPGTATRSTPRTRVSVVACLPEGSRLSLCFVLQVSRQFVILYSHTHAGDGLNVDTARYRMYERFEPSVETEVLVNAKYKALLFVELMIKIQSNTRLEVCSGQE